LITIKAGVSGHVDNGVIKALIQCVDEQSDILPFYLKGFYLLGIFRRANGSPFFCLNFAGLFDRNFRNKE
jgi:hypothetical protein